MSSCNREDEYAPVSRANIPNNILLTYKSSPLPAPIGQYPWSRVADSLEEAQNCAGYVNSILMNKTSIQFEDKRSPNLR
jgi:hypothetical protein